jgi:hypothetical protein
MPPITLAEDEKPLYIKNGIEKNQAYYQDIENKKEDEKWHQKSPT